MHKDKYVFAQLVEFLDNNKFRRLVEKYHGDFYVRHFGIEMSFPSQPGHWSIYFSLFLRHLEEGCIWYGASKE